MNPPQGYEVSLFVCNLGFRIWDFYPETKRGCPFPLLLKS